MVFTLWFSFRFSFCIPVKVFREVNGWFEYFFWYLLISGFSDLTLIGRKLNISFGFKHSYSSLYLVYVIVFFSLHCTNVLFCEETKMIRFETLKYDIIHYSFIFNLFWCSRSFAYFFVCLLDIDTCYEVWESFISGLVFVLSFSFQILLLNLQSLINTCKQVVLLGVLVTDL